MTKYLAYQIILHKLMYNNVIARFPKYKDDIDKVLDDMGWTIDTEGNCVGKKGGGIKYERLYLSNDGRTKGFSR